MFASAPAPSISTELRANLSPVTFVGVTAQNVDDKVAARIFSPRY